MTSISHLKNLICVVTLLLFSSLVQAQILEGSANSNSGDSALLEHALQAADPAKRSTVSHAGFLVEKIAQEYFVSQVLDGYPAHKAGLERGDKILASNGKPFNHLNVKNLASGNSTTANVPASSVVALASSGSMEVRYQRDNREETLFVSLSRENLFDSYRSASANSVQEFAAGNKIIGYVHFWALSNSTHDLNFFHQTIASLAHCDGLIIDLRNSAGFISPSHLAAIYPSESYYLRSLKSGPTVTAVGTLPARPTSIAALDSPSHWPHVQRQAEYDRDNYNKPIAILQNAHTRSGAESLSQQLQVLERVITIGTATARGSIPELLVEYPLTSHSVNDPQYQAAVDALIGII